MVSPTRIEIESHQDLVHRKDREKKMWRKESTSNLYSLGRMQPIGSHFIASPCSYLSTCILSLSWIHTIP